MDRAGEWLRVQQTVVVRGVEDGIDVLGESWMLALVHVRRGTIRYVRGGQEVPIPWRHFAVFAPPGTILQARLFECRIVTRAVASVSRAPGPSSAAEAWKVAPGAGLPATPDAARALLAARTDAVAIGRDVARAGIAWKTKRRLDTRYASPDSLHALSRELHTSPAALSRAFRRAYGMSPSEYRQRLRILAAVHHLTTGVPVVDALAGAGFGDVSQTYRKFRSLLCATPGSYTRSKTAKT